MLILFCGVQKILFPIDDFCFLFQRKKLKSPALTVPPLSHQTSCTPTKSNLYLARSLAAAVSEPVIHRLLTFQELNLTSIFRCLGHTRVSIQAPGYCKHFVTWYFLQWGVVSTSLNPPSWRTTPCRLSTTTCSIYSQLRSMLEAVPPSTTWGCTMLWLQRLTYHRVLHTKKHNYKNWYKCGKALRW